VEGCPTKREGMSAGVASSRYLERLAPYRIVTVRHFVNNKSTNARGRVTLYSFRANPAPNSQKRYKGHGVLLLGLYPGGYTWKHLALPESTFKDSGSGACSS
jgi:hypothetical protein